MNKNSFSNVESDAISDTIAAETEHCKVRFFSVIIIGFSSFLAGYTLSILAPFYSKEAEELRIFSFPDLLNMDQATAEPQGKNCRGT